MGGMELGAAELTNCMRGAGLREGRIVVAAGGFLGYLANPNLRGGGLVIIRGRCANDTYLHRLIPHLSEIWMARVQ